MMLICIALTRTLPQIQIPISNRQLKSPTGYTRDVSNLIHLEHNSQSPTPKTPVLVIFSSPISGNSFLPAAQLPITVISVNLSFILSQHPTSVNKPCHPHLQNISLLLSPWSNLATCLTWNYCNGLPSLFSIIYL